jgi:hypothetical protein
VVVEYSENQLSWHSLVLEIVKCCQAQRMVPPGRFSVRKKRSMGQTRRSRTLSLMLSHVGMGAF